MKNFINEYLRVPKTGKLNEKVLLTRITLSIIFILGCLVAMSFSAYAYYSCNIESSFITIQSANYKLDVAKPDGVEDAIGGVYTLTNDTDATKEYSFTLTKPAEEGLASVGFCKIKVKTDANNMTDVNDVQTFYTKPIGTFVEGGVKTTLNSRTVTIKVAPNSTAVVSFTAELGTCSRTPVIDEELVPNFSVTVTEPVTPTDGQEPDPTEGNENTDVNE